MPELRIDPVVGRKVLIAEDRAGRPFDYSAAIATTLQTSASAAECCFCRYHEQETPPCVAERCNDQGNWTVRVVPNKFPAFSLSPDDGAYGAHEVIIESPGHHRDWLDLSTRQIADVLAMFRDRMLHWKLNERLQHALVFKNSGYLAGASLEHVHSQLIATASTADSVQAELDACHTHYLRTNRRQFDDLLERELGEQERVVSRVGEHVALCAYAGRQPYETWIVPEGGSSQFEDTTDDELFRLAQLMRRLIGRLDDCLPQLAYNLVLHSGPFDGSYSSSYTWHWELIPRSTQLAGIELGGGFFINSASPERAAAQLRESLTAEASAAHPGESAGSVSGLAKKGLV